MNRENIITYGLVGFVVTLVMTFLNKAAGKQLMKSESGEYELRIHNLYNMIGLSAVGIGLIGIVAFLVYQEPDMIYMAIVLNIIFTPLGIVCILWYKNHKLIFNEKEVTTVNWLGKATTIQWTAINSINFNPFSGQVILKANKTTLKAHQHLMGLSDFFTTLTLKTNLPIDGLKLPFIVKTHRAQ